MTPPRGEAVAKLQKGQFTNVALQTKSDWHVLKLDDVRALTPPSFDQVPERLRQRRTSQQVQKLVGVLRAKASIELVK